MKAMILSAGFGTRLKPLTDKLPKALVRYKNVPMINHQIEKLKSIGVDEIIVNSHHLSNKIIDHFSGTSFGIDISLIVEEDILGTGGGILNAKQCLRNEEFFLVINVDVATDMDLERLIIHHRSQNPFATLAVQKRKTKRFLEFDRNMKLVGRSNENSEQKNLFAFNGIHIISGRIFDLRIKNEFQDILSIYFYAIKNRKEFISGYDAGNASFKDLGKKENLLSLD